MLDCWSVRRYAEYMFQLFDRAFWRFTLGFVLILVVSFSILVVTGAYRDIKEEIAAALVRFTSLVEDSAVNDTDVPR